MSLNPQPSKVSRSLHDRDKPYAIIDKKLICDKNVSPKSRLILIFMLSKPDDWQFYQHHLASEIGIGEESLVSGINELIENGYIKRTRDENAGKFKPYSYEISEFKRFIPNREIRSETIGPKNPDILNKDPTKKGSNYVFKKEDIPRHHPSSSKQKIIPSFDPATFTPETYLLPNGENLSDRCIAQFRKYKPEDLPKLYASIEYMEMQYTKGVKSDPEVYLQKCINNGYAQTKLDRENNRLYAQIIKDEKEIPFVIMKTVVKFPDGESISLDLNPISFGQVLENKQRNYKGKI